MSIFTFKSNLFLPTAAAAGIIVVSFGVSAFASFTEPTTAPPAGNAYAPLDTGPATNTKQGSLILNGSLYAPYGGITVQNALNISGNQVWTTAGDLYLQYNGASNSYGVIIGGNPGSPSPAADLYVNPTKASGGSGDIFVGGYSDPNDVIRVDGSNAYIFPWGTGATGNVYLGGGGQTTNFLIANGSLCLNGSCITSWPSSNGAVAASCPATAASNVSGSGGMSGTLPAASNGYGVEIDHGICNPIWYVCVDGTWALTQHASGCGW